MHARPIGLAGSVAFVTGASRGIGKATAVALAAAGAHVILGIRDNTEGEQAAKELRQRGLSAEAVTLDVAHYPSVKAALDHISKRNGRLDILINNAGVIGPLSRIAESDPGEWTRAIAVNLVGVFNTCRAALPLMARGGTIVNVSSSAADAPVPAMSAYCAAKAGLTMFTRSLASECQPAGIRVFGFRPGRIDTDMHAELRAARVNALADLDRATLAPVEKPAAAIVFLCSQLGDRYCGSEIDLSDVAGSLTAKECEERSTS